MSFLDKMKDAKNVYDNVKKAQQEIEKISVEGQAGGGSVKVKVKGNHQIVDIIIEEPVRVGDAKILNDLIIAACNDAMNKLDKEIKSKMGGIMNIPTGFKLPF
ncbi:MAG: YbaB/EbfC family nucleoid-associated protein [Gammaproteobacteria bacterium]|nr:YbaB/EbfC family nucleoid-associated protein [Gammaproteobacteria bacterium]|tara:strand:- start:365 stop:673 length:309 start_codon:yes stop_codon:yes gene_type:complete